MLHVGNTSIRVLTVDANMFWNICKILEHVIQHMFSECFSASFEVASVGRCHDIWPKDCLRFVIENLSLWC